MTQEALKELLEAVEAAIQAGDWKVDGACDPDKAISRARKALAHCPDCGQLLGDAGHIHTCSPQPEQEPVTLLLLQSKQKFERKFGPCWQADWIYSDLVELLDTTPPQRTWVGLTRMDLIKCGVLPFGMSYELCQAIEAKLKEKNT